MRLIATAPTIDEATLNAIVTAQHNDPFGVLGMHLAGEHLVVRVFRPDARSVEVENFESRGKVYPALHVHLAGFFEAVIEDTEQRFRYVLNFTGHDGRQWQEHDPYN